MASVAAPDKPPQRRRKKPGAPLPLLPLESRMSDFPTGSSESSVVPELPAPFDMSANSNASTASEMTSTSSTSASSSSRGVKWWKRVTAMRPKRRRTEGDSHSLDQEMYVRSILESYASSMSSKDRYSTSNPQFSVDDSSSNSNSSKKSGERASRRRREEKQVTATDTDTGSDRREDRDSDSPAYMAHFTPNGDTQDEHHVDMDNHTQPHLTAGVPGLSSGSSPGPYDDVLDDGPFAPSSVSDEEDKNRRRLQRRMKIEAMRSRLLEKNQHRARARKKMCIFIACIGVTLTAFVVAAVLIARVGVEIQSNSLVSSTNTTTSNSSSGSGSIALVTSGSIGSEADLSLTSSGSTLDGSSSSASADSSGDDDSDWSDSNNGSSIYTDSYTYIHCILMVLSLWMSLVVVIMHVTFRSFRTYSHPFVLELSCVQCGYWITSLLRVMLETSTLTDMAYLFFCMFECFFNFAQISFTCAIAFNMYRSVVSYADVLMDSQSARRRYHRYTMNVLLLSVVAAVTLALVGYRSGDTYDYYEEDDSKSGSSTEEEILDEETFSPCLYPTCRLILYVYYPLLAFGFNFIFYVRFKRTIGESYPTSATGRLNKVARSYLIVFFVCWGSLIILTALKVADSANVPTIASCIMQSIFDILGVCTAAITFTNFHRCRKAFDFGLSLKAIDPSSIEFDDPVNIVGEGTFAIVLKARWRQGGYVDGPVSRSIEVAVKTFKHAQMECLEHIKEEAYLSSKLVHPCVMMTYGCYTSGINLYIVYEYLGGGTLQDLIDTNRSTPFSYERGLRYAHMIAVGMRFLHGLPVPIVHRDLKPLNCIFDSEQEMLKVADFGESRLLRTRDVVAPRPNFFPSADVTVQMTTNIGSACWAAPEVLKDEATSEYSVKIDVYSFGIICWQLFTCAVPYADIPGSVLAVAEAVLSGVRPPIPRNCPRLFTKIMKRCWHDNPLRRPSFEDIVQLLEIELTEERRRQLARAHGRGNDSVIAPPVLNSNNFDDSGQTQGTEYSDSELGKNV
ncbi:putative serine/threonine-protein kinase/receptor [Phytophthora citrophthora]|uniref:Serine/threonine-protein kinase/receptor n=1 Tax=Phytophthora citrophthora TaxID=4793 RepID=A0AAD9GA06_9STRA|nr:putative serine/threonine-protein kinase/receptor [Phytophthora citrophthora]